MGVLKDVFDSSIKNEDILGEQSRLYAENVYLPQFIITESSREDGCFILSAHIGVMKGEENKIPVIKERIWQKMREIFEKKGMHVQNYGETQIRLGFIQKKEQKFSQQIMHIFIDPNHPK